MALKTYNITFTPAAGSSGTQVDIRKVGDSVWATPNTPDNPTTLATYPLTLDDSFSWTVRVSAVGSKCLPKYKYLTIPAGTSVDTLLWVENTFTCEQDSPLTLESTFTGFSSPFLVYPNPNTGMCYVVDSDYSVSNAYKFNPSSFTGIGSITTIPGQFEQVYSAKVDTDYNRIYITGKNTGGLKVLDMATDLYTTVSYGADGVNFNRILLFVTATKIFGYDFYANAFAEILRSDLSLIGVNTAESYPSGATYIKNSYLYEVGSEIWSVSEFRSTGTIGVYNSDFSSLITTITVAGVVGENGGANYRQSGFYDSANDKFYLSDAGSKKIFIIDGATRTVVYTITFDNTFGKSNVFCGLYIDSVTGDYFLFAQCYNSAGVDIINKSYKINPITYELEDFFANVHLSNLYYQPGTNFQWGADGGVSVWNTPNTGYDTDGTITKFTR